MEKMFAGVPTVALLTFGTAEAAKILGIPIWRLQKFLDSPRYQLSPEGKLGKGKGSRRVFRIEDIYRIAIAVQLVRDGFEATFIGSILRQIEDRDLMHLDEKGSEAPIGIALERSIKGPKLQTFDPKHPPKVGVAGAPYYVLDLGDVISEVDGRIAKLKR
jgi:hypothetical protein